MNENNNNKIIKEPLSWGTIANIMLNVEKKGRGECMILRMLNYTYSTLSRRESDRKPVFLTADILANPTADTFLSTSWQSPSQGTNIHCYTSILSVWDPPTPPPPSLLPLFTQHPSSHPVLIRKSCGMFLLGGYNSIMWCFLFFSFFFCLFCFPVQFNSLYIDDHLLSYKHINTSILCTATEEACFPRGLM